VSDDYVHGYHRRESNRLRDQAGALVHLLHSDSSYPPGSKVLEAGCGVGVQTIPLARSSPGASVVSIDISADSIAQAKARVRALNRTAEAEGVFCYTFFKALGTKAPRA